MAISTDYNASQSTESTRNTPKTLEQLQQEVQAAYDKIREAAQQMGKSAYAMVHQEVAKLYKEYAAALRDPARYQNLADSGVADQILAMKLILDEPILDTASDVAKQKQEKEAAEKALNQFAKKYERSQSELSQQEDVKQNSQTDLKNKYIDNARRILEMRKELVQANVRDSRWQNQNLLREQEGRKNFFGLMNLIKTPKVLVGENPKTNPNLLMDKNGKPLSDPQKAASQTKPNKNTLQDGDVAETGLEEAFSGDFESPEKNVKEATTDENEFSDELIASDSETQVDEGSVDEAMQLVQNALANGVLQNNAGALLLNPKRNVIELLREIDNDSKDLLEDASSAESSAMVFVAQGAIRHAKVRLFTSLHRGNLRNGDAEDVALELKRVKKNGSRVAQGMATQNTTTPDTILENGKISSSKSREQLAKYEGRNIVGFATFENDPVLRMHHSFAHWTPVDETVAAELRRHTREILS